MVEELWNHYQSCHSVDMEVFKNSTVNSELTRLDTWVDGNNTDSFTTFIPQKNETFMGAKLVTNVIFQHSLFLV